MIAKFLCKNPILTKNAISKFYSKFYRNKISLKKQKELHDRGKKSLLQYIFKFIHNNTKKIIKFENT